MSDTFLYAVFDSDKQTVIYIGVTSNPYRRLYQHQLLRFRSTIDLFVIRRVSCYNASYWERLAILAARRLGYRLENKNSGGSNGHIYPTQLDTPFQVLPSEVCQLQAVLETEEVQLRTLLLQK